MNVLAFGEKKLLVSKLVAIYFSPSIPCRARCYLCHFREPRAKQSTKKAKAYFISENDTNRDLKNSSTCAFRKEFRARINKLKLKRRTSVDELDTVRFGTG